MSTDNWTHCPKCSLKWVEKIEAVRTAAEKAYGKVSAEEYNRLLEAAKKPAEALPETLREDYEIGIDRAGVFEVIYRSSCAKCGFGFKHQEIKNALTP